MEGSVLSFLKTEWKVSDTCSAHWASSFNVNEVARDADNNKLHNEKTPQLIKDQRYDSLNRRDHFKHRGRKKIIGMRQVGGWGQKICVFTVTCQKNRSGLILIFFLLLSAKPKIVVPGSGIRFRYFIFEISGKSSFIETVLWRIMQFSTSFALNFDKKLVVEKIKHCCWLNNKNVEWP